MKEERLKWYEGIPLKSGEETQDKDWWKAQEGKYKIVFVGEPSEPYEVEYNKKKRMKRAFNFLVTDKDNVTKEVVFGVTVAQTRTSLYGQLILLANKHGGLDGVETEILVQGEGKSRKYTIPEVVDYEPEDFVTDETKESN